MTASMLDALAGVGYLGLICTTFLLLPKIWRPEILFGVAVRDQAGREMGLRALRYWNKRVLLLATTAAGCTILLALFLRRPWPFIPAGGFLASAALAYVRAR